MKLLELGNFPAAFVSAIPLKQPLFTGVDFGSKSTFSLTNSKLNIVGTKLPNSLVRQ